MIRFCQMLITFSLVVSLCLPPDVEAVEEGVQNVNFRVQGQKVHISYDLIGQGTYTVKLVLLRHWDRSFSKIPWTLSGDVGKEIRPGKGRSIVWDALKDVGSLEGNDYVFEVRAARPGKSNKWVWIGGVAVAGGAVAGAVLLGKDGEEKKGTIVIDLPDPEE